MVDVAADIATLQSNVIAEFSYMFNVVADVVANVMTLEFDVVNLTALF